MVRKIVYIDQEKCNGCGACAAACHEGAIAMVDGKARLIRDDYCDGLGDCLPACPVDAIEIIEREAVPYDEAAVKANQGAKGQAAPQPWGCPGSRSRLLERQEAGEPAPAAGKAPSRLMQWPVQIKLAPLQAPYFQGAKLLVAADCTAYAYAAFHEKFIRGRITLVGCPKLDGVDYAEKLSAILQGNDIKNVTVVRMEVPCCGGLEHAVRRALEQSGKCIPWQVVTISTDGRILED